jgi:hypothetical protein
MAGRPPKEKSFANMLNIALTAKGTTGETKLREVAEVLVSKALEGESWAIKEVADRVDGKPMQQVELSGVIQSRLNALTDDELESIATGSSAGTTETPQSPSQLN